MLQLILHLLKLVQLCDADLLLEKSLSRVGSRLHLLLGLEHDTLRRQQGPKRGVNVHRLRALRLQRHHGRFVRAHVVVEVVGIHKVARGMALTVDLKKLLHTLVIRVSQLGVRRAVLRPCNISPDKASEIKVRQEFVGGPVHRVRRAGQRQRVQECLGESGGLDDRPLVHIKKSGGGNHRTRPGIRRLPSAGASESKCDRSASVVAVCAVHRAAARARRSGQASTHVVRADPGACSGATRACGLSMFRALPFVPKSGMDSF